MSEFTRRTLVFRGSDISSDAAGGFEDDPNHLEAKVSVTSAVPTYKAEGSATTYVGGLTRGPRSKRLVIAIETWGYTTDASLATDETQDYGEYLWLEHVLSRRNVSLHRALAGGSATNAINRADRHAPDVDGVNSFWNATSPTLDGYPSSPAGYLPSAIELIEPLSPQLSSGGIHELAFNVQGLYPVVS